MRFGIYVPNFGEFADLQNLLRLAEAAEAAGWDALFLWDHILLDKHTAPPMVDAWIALAAIAARTRTLLIGPMVAPLPRRRPWKLARETVSLDHLSGGRMILGVGLGAPPNEEFECFGEDPSEVVRAEKLDEALEIVTGLWGGRPYEHTGKYFKVDGVTFRPRPIQSPRIPIWVAARVPNERPVLRALRWDGVFPLKRHPSGTTRRVWSSLWLSENEFREVVAFVRRGRGPETPAFEIVATGATSTDKLEGWQAVAPFVDAGATWWLEWLDDQRGSFEEMLSRVIAGPPAKDYR